MIKDQRGASLVGVMVAIGLSTLLLLLVLNSTTDKYLVKNVTLEVERDLDYSLNAISKSLVHTSSISQDIDINIPYYLDVLNVEKPNTLYLRNIYQKDGTIKTDGLKLDVINSRLVTNVKLSLAISDADKLFGATTGPLATAAYSFKSNEYSKFTINEGSLNVFNPVIRYTGNYVTGLNLSYTSEIPKSVDQDNLRIKVPVEAEGGNIIGGTYKAE